VVRHDIRIDDARIGWRGSSGELSYAPAAGARW